MLYHLSLYLLKHNSFFNIVHYVSFRAIASLISALFFSILFGKWFIGKSKKMFPSRARPWTPKRVKNRDHMPTMGGLLILMCVILNTLLWANLFKYEVWIFLLCLLGFGVIGFVDDWQKIHHDDGISARLKLGLQLFVGMAVVAFWFAFSPPSTQICIPFFKNFQPDLGLFFILWVVFILVGASNAVNLTDGLDGLAIGSLISNFFAFSIIAYLAGHISFASYLNIPYAGCEELAVLGAIMVGVSLGFLWYNTYPAQIVMGDVGSLSLGAGLALMALMSKQELLLVISGGLFVVETVSVIIQVLSFKFLGRRLFKMAPLHHHFELLGWQESKITIRFAIISIVLTLLTLITLKVR
ncbi:phospho-N-acetylmuramoyl-pentapeptide-transferase [bacterium]|jgi:phospho-N-acetylmuramoyl-pentapeptide-transferase|nr:phospho-N-acetylmuramoyl-pentapeptide-transferase [bacterium]